MARLNCLASEPNVCRLVSVITKITTVLRLCFYTGPLDRTGPRDQVLVLVDIVLKFLNKSAVNQIIYSQLTHTEPGALGAPHALGPPLQLTSW